MTTLTVQGLDIHLGGRSVLHNITTSIREGGLVGLVGRNGAGKSTLVRTLARLITPEQGCVLLDEADITHIPRKSLAKQISYLPQGHTLHWPLEARHVVALGRLPHLPRFARAAGPDETAIHRAMERTDVLALSDREMTTLSGGERARIMLARALASETPILLADEPVTSLDPFHQLLVMELLRDIAREGRLVIAVLHDLPLAARFCERLILLEGGQIVADGEPQIVLSSKNLDHAYSVKGIYGNEDGERFVLPWRRLNSVKGDVCVDPR
jgi:iron complex transport system ATP-binding protein